MRPSFGSQTIPLSGQSLSETYLLWSLRVPDKTSENRKNAGQSNVELDVLILATIFGPGKDATQGRKTEIKSTATSCENSVFSRTAQNAAILKSTCSLLFLWLLADSSELTTVSQFRSFSFSEADSIKRFLGLDALHPMLRFEGPSTHFELSANFWENEKWQQRFEGLKTVKGESTPRSLSPSSKNAPSHMDSHCDCQDFDQRNRMRYNRGASWRMW